MGEHINERCRACKDTIYLLLSRIDGNVEQQHDLGLPAHLNSYKGTSCFASLELIYDKLLSYRGCGLFVKTDKLPKVDYYLPLYRLVVEFDESQHFTRPRFISLSYYPSDLVLGYGRHKWMELSRHLNRKDNDPPYRDEQRAWYDTLRDFSSVVLGNQPTVRLYAGDRQWCSMDAYSAKDIASFRVLVMERMVSTSRA
jgi:hypothetical protein